jgi:hypothetical protein
MLGNSGRFWRIFFFITTFLETFDKSYQIFLVTLIDESNEQQTFLFEKNFACPFSLKVYSRSSVIRFFSGLQSIILLNAKHKLMMVLFKLKQFGKRIGIL